jgi:hypothetical protein
LGDIRSYLQVLQDRSLGLGQHEFFLLNNFFFIFDFLFRLFNFLLKIFDFFKDLEHVFIVFASESEFFDKNSLLIEFWESDVSEIGACSRSEEVESQRHGFDFINFAHAFENRNMKRHMFTINRQENAVFSEVDKNLVFH